MNQSGIWVDCEKAKQMAEDTIVSVRRYYWRQYLKFCREERNRTNIFGKRISYRTYLKRRNKARGMLENEKEWCRYFRDNRNQILCCKMIIKACEVPPADGKIYLTIDDVDYIK